MSAAGASIPYIVFKVSLSCRAQKGRTNRWRTMGAAGASIPCNVLREPLDCKAQKGRTNPWRKMSAAEASIPCIVLRVVEKNWCNSACCWSAGVPRAPRIHTSAFSNSTVFCLFTHYSL
eukprot:1045937-Pelagomonas_calceolata.AAC.3